MSANINDEVIHVDNSPSAVNNIPTGEDRSLVSIGANSSDTSACLESLTNMKNGVTYACFKPHIRSSNHNLAALPVL